MFKRHDRGSLILSFDCQENNKAMTLTGNRFYLQ